MESEWMTESSTPTPETFNDSSLIYNDMYGPKRDTLYIVVPITIIYAVIFLTGLIGNVSTCIVIARNKSMHTATNYYLFSLAISDLLLLISGLPQEMYSIWSRYPDVFGQTFCILRGLFAETSANATVLTITAFTVERYMAICHPFLSHTMSKLSRAVKLILIIWMVAICFAVPQALQFGVAPSYRGVSETDTCQIVHTIIEHSFEVSTFLFFVAPMTLITVLYALIGLRLKSSSMIKKNSGESVRSVNGRNLRNRGGRHQHGQSSRRVLKMLVAVVVAFFICWAPFHAQRLVAVYFTPEDHERNHYLKIYEIVTYISGILYYVSTTINPVLYNIMSNKFREAFKETFARCCGLARIKSGRPRRSYSVLSRSAQRATDSNTDSGREEASTHTNTTLTHKNSADSMNLHSVGRRFNGRKLQESENAIVTIQWTKCRTELPLNAISKTGEDSRGKYVVVRIANGTPTKRTRFWQLFTCIAKRTLDDNRRFSGYYASPMRETSTSPEFDKTNSLQRFPSMSPCEISNSSLRDIENGALEDELTAYMQEIRRRERNS